jgi:glucose-1-phosphatase
MPTTASESLRLSKRPESQSEGHAAADTAMTKLIIFDIGGVIQGLDWSPIVNSLTDIKRGIDIDQYKEAFYYDREKNFDLYATGRIAGEEFWGMVASRLCIDSEHIPSLSKTFQLIYSFIDTDLLKVIETLKRGYSLCILSNACPEIETKVISDSKYTHLFDEMFFSHRIGCKKPDKQAFKTVLDAFKVEPGECVFIDNDFKNTSAAERFGFTCVLYKGVADLNISLSEILQ